MKDWKQYDFGIVDVNMPIMNGIEMTKEVRKNKIPIPLIAFTSNEEYHHVCLQEGMDYFQTKPLNREAMGKTIDDILRKQGKSVLSGSSSEPGKKRSLINSSLQTSKRLKTSE